MAKIKVLIIYHYLAHYRLPVFLELMRQNQKGIQYTLMSGIKTDINIKTIDTKLAFLPVSEGGLRWKIIKNYWVFNKLLWQPKIIRESIFGSYNSIIFLGNSYFISTWFALVLSRLFGKNTLMWTHGAIRGKSIKDKVRILNFHLSEVLLLYNKEAKNNLIINGFKENRLFVVYNSLDYKRQVNIRNAVNPSQLINRKNELFVYNNFPILIFIGRLTRQKKLNELVSTVKLLHDANIYVNLLIIGGGEEYDSLSIKVRDNKLTDYVIFYGECYDEGEIAPLIMMADICVAPGEIGLTAIHSLTYGTPVITHNSYINQMPEYEVIIPKVNGMLYQYGNILSLVEMIKKWLIMFKDKRDIVRENCYKMVDRYYNPRAQVKIINDSILARRPKQ